MKKEKEMGITDTILYYMALAEEAYEAMTATMGFVALANGKKANDSAEQEKGFNKMIGGGFIYEKRAGPKITTS